MKFLSKEYWNQRYLDGETGWDLGEISPPLQGFFDSFTNKNIAILIPGAGNSYEGEYLINNGFTNVTILDFAESAITNFKARVKNHAMAKFVQDDFFNHSGQYDVIIEQTFFCALDPNLRKEYVRKMKSLLKPGGMLAGLLFDDALNTDKPPYGGSKDEYEALFSTDFQVMLMDTAFDSVKPREGRELFFMVKLPED